MNVVEEGDTVTFSTDIGEVGLVPTKDGKQWYILFEGFISQRLYKISSITFTRREYPLEDADD